MNTFKNKGVGVSTLLQRAIKILDNNIVHIEKICRNLQLLSKKEKQEGRVTQYR